ncbi:hypothetical protein KIN20_021328 [Parelaphostrongylus tenuis]|uniref:Uncharacterized protein n=1 Tax=Parelaphostrongylus tenuis TaxID=148309 RepID=A0AAD5MNS7_PARTN|nr:hypothetical protein KIN20_021328 [Parelaphostrongylus tenuis]
MTLPDVNTLSAPVAEIVMLMITAIVLSDLIWAYSALLRGVKNVIKIVQSRLTLCNPIHVQLESHPDALNTGSGSATVVALTSI